MVFSSQSGGFKPSVRHIPKMKVSPPTPSLQTVKTNIGAFKIPFVDTEGKCPDGLTLTGSGKCASSCQGSGFIDNGSMCIRSIHFLRPVIRGRLQPCPAGSTTWSGGLCRRIESYNKLIRERVLAAKPVPFIGKEDTPSNATPRQKLAYDTYKAVNSDYNKIIAGFNDQWNNFQKEKLRFETMFVNLTNINNELVKAIAGAGIEHMPEPVPGSVEKANKLKKDYDDIVRTIFIMMGNIHKTKRTTANGQLAKASLAELKTDLDELYDIRENMTLRRNAAVEEVASANAEAAAAAEENARTKAAAAAADALAKEAAAQTALVTVEAEEQAKRETRQLPSNPGLPNYCGDLGKPSADGSMQIYTREECDKLDGVFHGNGECGKKGGGSYSWDCRPRLLTESSVSLAATTIPPPSTNPTQEQLITRQYVEPRVIYNGKRPNVLEPVKNYPTNMPKREGMLGDMPKREGMLGGKRRKNSYISRKLKARSSRKKRNSGNKSRRRR
jgi:hypothetical protein